MRASLQATLHVLNRPEPLRQSSLLMVLASGIGDAESLIQGLQALGTESDGIWQNRVNQLLYLLNSGQGMSEALNTTGGLLPNDTLVAIRVAEENGTLKQVLGEEAHRLSYVDAEQNPVRPSLSSTLLWTLFVALFMSATLLFVFVQIIPQYVRIFQDFDVQLPAATELLMAIASPIREFWGLILFPNLTLIVVPILAIVYGLYRHITTGHVLFSERLVRYWSPLILRTLGTSVAADGPIGPSLELIAKQLPVGRGTKALSAVRQKVISGFDALESLMKSGFITTSELNFLKSAQKNNHLDWALMHLATSLSERRRMRTNRCVAILQPTFVIGLGAVMAFVCVSLFLPLIQLVNNMT